MVLMLMPCMYTAAVMFKFFAQRDMQGHAVALTPHPASYHMHSAHRCKAHLCCSARAPV